MLTPTVFIIAQDGTPPPPTPDAPSGLTLSPASETVLDVSWTDGASDEIRYELEYDTDAGYGSPTQVTLAVDAASHQITGLVAGTTYYVRVRAVNASGDGAWASANTTMPGDPPERIDSVGGYATATNSFRLHWTDVGDEDHFELERNTASDFTGTSVTTTVASGTVHYDWTTGVTSGTYYVRARGVSDTKGSGTWRGYAANSASGDYDSGFGFVRVPASLASPPTAPASVTATVNSATQITLGWTAGSGGGFTGTQIVAARDSSYEDAAELRYDTGTGAETAAFTGLASNTQYWFRLRSYDSVNGDYSAWEAVTATTEPSVVPTAPTGFAATTTAPTTLDFAWTDPAGQQITAVQGDIAEDAAFSVNNQNDTGIGVGTEAKQWTGLTEGTQYYSRVRAVNAAGNGSYATTTAYTQHAAPSSLAETDNGSFWTLTWTRNSATNTGVEIHRNTGSGYSVFDDTLGATTTSYSVTKNAGYSWKVRNTGPGVASGFSNEFVDPT